MRQNRFLNPARPVLGCACLGLAMLAAACSHPTTGGTTTTGGGGGTTGGGGSSGGGVGPGNGGSGGGEVILPDGGSGQVTKAACNADPNQQHALPYTDGQIVADSDRSLANSAVANLTTLSAKVDQLHRPNPGTETTDIFRTADTGGIKGFQFRDGPRGVNLDAVKPGGAPGYSTAFPVASLRGATFDVDLENQVGLAMGDELIAASGTMILAPTVNILRHPAWGRAEETYGEDSFLLGRLGSAYVMGVQKFAPACVKHFAANNIELNRGSAVAAMDDQTLHEVYARHFGMIIKDGGVACVMAAYNLIQLPGQTAVNCTQNAHLLHDILRTEFGFQGMVLSDWWAMPGGRSVTSSASTYARQAITSGLEMELPDYINFT